MEACGGLLPLLSIVHSSSVSGKKALASRFRRDGVLDGEFFPRLTAGDDDHDDEGDCKGLPVSLSLELTYT